jgi:hypothetical protein
MVKSKEYYQKIDSDRFFDDNHKVFFNRDCMDFYDEIINYDDMTIIVQWMKDTMVRVIHDEQWYVLYMMMILKDS